MGHVFGRVARTMEPEQTRHFMEHCNDLALLSNSQALVYATADTAADTKLLGHEWLVVAIEPLRNIDLVGFDAAHVRTKGLSLVTVKTNARTEDGDETILRKHQSFSNPTAKTAKTTLLAAAQKVNETLTYRILQMTHKWSSSAVLFDHIRIDKASRRE